MSNLTNSTNSYRYILEKGGQKYVCPSCGKIRMVRYIDSTTNEYLPFEYGRCDRESKCSYHLNPYLNGYAKLIWEQEKKVSGVSEVSLPKQRYFFTSPKPQPKQKPIFFDFDTFKQTLDPKRYKNNVFIQNLFYNVPFPFEVKDITKVVQLYRLGTVTNGYRAGAITFPFIDKGNNVRAIQVKEFDNTNHTKSTDFLHSIIEKHYTKTQKPLPDWLASYIKQDKRITCLFGEHLLSKYPNNPIALVEAPKTAVYGTLYFGLPETPESLIWLAVYNKSSFSFDKLKVLQGRFVYVFPDLSESGNTYKEWETKAKEYESRLKGTRFILSDLLEQLAPKRDKGKGFDVGDYLIKQDWKDYRKRNIKEKTPQPQPEPILTPQPIIEAKNEPLHIETEKYTPIQPKVEVEKVDTNKEKFYSYRNEDLKQTEQPKPQNWSNEIKELQTFFASIEIPKQLKLNDYSTITDCSKFIESHFNILSFNNGVIQYLPYLNRLKELKEALGTNLI